MHLGCTCTLIFLFFYRLATKFEENWHVVTYCDTDSLLAFAVHPNAPEIDKLCEISERLGCLKIEKDGIKKFFSTAAKTYSVETVTGEITIKAKGFNLLEKLLKDNSQQCLLEKNVTKMFTAVSEANNMPDTSTFVFQKQIKVNPTHMVPALQPREQSYKILNFIGPRRQIDVGNWLTFSYKRILQLENNRVKIDPLQSSKPMANPNDKLIFYCTNQQNATFVPTKKDDKSDNDQKYQVQLVPKIHGLLPALPYGFDIKNVKKNLPFYLLLK